MTGITLRGYDLVFAEEACRYRRSLERRNWEYGEERGISVFWGEGMSHVEDTLRHRRGRAGTLLSSGAGVPCLSMGKQVLARGKRKEEHTSATITSYIKKPTRDQNLRTSNEQKKRKIRRRRGRGLGRRLRKFKVQ